MGLCRDIEIYHGISADDRYISAHSHSLRMLLTLSDDWLLSIEGSLHPKRGPHAKVTVFSVTLDLRVLGKSQCGGNYKSLNPSFRMALMMATRGVR